MEIEALITEFNGAINWKTQNKQEIPRRISDIILMVRVYKVLDNCFVDCMVC